METSLLICRPNRWTGFYVMGTSDKKEFPLDTCNVNAYVMMKLLKGF